MEEEEREAYLLEKAKTIALEESKEREQTPGTEKTGSQADP